MKNLNRLESPTPANQCGSTTTANNTHANLSAHTNIINNNNNNSDSSNIPSNNSNNNNGCTANGAINNSISSATTNTAGNGSSGNVNDGGGGGVGALILSTTTTPIATPTAIQHHNNHHHHHHHDHHHQQYQKSNVPNSPPNNYNTVTNGHQSYPSISSTYWLPPSNPAPYLVPERKLFVGMLNKKYNEADVRQLFTGHGTIEECTVLRDQNGQSKGCAFVTFATKHNAIGAIKALHQSRTMEGCSAPLVVKFADTQKEKDQKKMQQLQASLVGITTLTTPPAGSITGLAATPSNGLSSAAAAALVPSPLTAASVRSNSSMSAALAAVTAGPQPTAVANPTTALVPTTGAISVPPSLLTAAGSPQQTSPYLTTTDAMNASAAQFHIFQQLQAFGLHPAQYLQVSQPHLYRPLPLPPTTMPLHHMQLMRLTSPPTMLAMDYSQLDLFRCRTW